MLIDGGGGGFQGQVKEVPPLICFKCRASRKREKITSDSVRLKSQTLCLHVKWLWSDLLPLKYGGFMRCIWLLLHDIQQGFPNGGFAEFINYIECKIEINSAVKISVNACN